MPVLKNCEIDDLAEAFLRDYNAFLLTMPQPIDIEAFAEFYLNLSLDYVYLSHCGLILGRMVFQEMEQIPVYLPEENCANYLYAKRGTLLIDNTVLEDRKEYRLRSTIGHECGHWLLHSDYYTGKDKRNHLNNVPLEGITGYKNTDIEGGAELSGGKRLVTDIDWLEHHAKYFSAAMLMPKTPFMKAVSDLADNGLCDEAVILEKLADIFQVSPLSVKIRLSQLGSNRYILRNERTQDEEKLKILLQISGGTQ